MLKPTKEQAQAIRGMASAAPSFYRAYVEYLNAARDHERGEMEACASDQTEVLKGKSRCLTEHLNNLKSLVPDGG
jgi:hypothetical protein